MLIAKFTSMFSPTFKNITLLFFDKELLQNHRFWRCSFYNFKLVNHRKSWSPFILMRNEGVVASCQQMATTWVNQLSLLVQNDKNEILKPVKNNQKFLFYINHYLFILISITQKYSIFWNINLIREKLTISWSKQSTS